MPKIKFLQVLKKDKITLVDELHVIGYGTNDSLKPEIIKKYYNNINFNFDYLQQAQNYFKGIFGKNFESFNIRCMIPTFQGPIIFKYESDQFSNKKKKKMFFAISPMIIDEKKECQICNDNWKRKPKKTPRSKLSELNLCTKHYSAWRNANCIGTA